MAYGTLLGGVRHNGFIPWEDDIDVWMKRDDYNKLLSMTESVSDDQWELLSFEKSKGYLFPWAKMCNKKTILLPSRFNTGLKYGISIDIFPLDYFPGAGYETAREQALSEYKKFNADYNASHPYTGGVNDPVRLAKKKAEFMLSKIRGIAPERLLNSYSTDNQKEGSEYLVCMQTPVFGCFRSEWFEQDVLVEFEKGKYPSPEMFDEVLTSIYGDWRTPPPEDKRVTHHSFTAYWK